MWKRTDRWALVAVLSFAASGCATPPLAVQQKVSVAAQRCPPCGHQTHEVERLLQDLASRTAEVRDLRSDQRVQVKVLQESKREVTRAKVKLRRLATRADAASYIAEVEVARESLLSSRGAMSTAPQMVQAKRLLQSTAAPFAQGDYGLAMDRAAEAEQLIVSAAANLPRRPLLVRKKQRTPLHPRLVASSQRE